MTNYTETQRRAIAANGSLLISAAAGSGKTSVLTARLLRLIEDGFDIRRMLICTFTNAAAREMRGRISAALSRRAEETGTLRLRAQADWALTADICTIHRFAIKVARESRFGLGLPENFRIASDDELAVLKNRAFKTAADELNALRDESLLRLRRRYSGADDRRLREIVFSLYNYMVSRPEREKWLERAAEIPAATYLELLSAETAAMLDELCEQARTAIELSEADGITKQIEKDETELALAQNARAAFHADSAERYTAALRGVAIARCANGLSKEYKQLKKGIRELVKGLQEQDPAEARETIERETEYMHGEALAFLRVLTLFDEEFSALKLERRLLDFDDTLYYAYKALSDDDAAAAIRARYDFVFIDEYQDTNPLQDALIRRVANEDGVFMVGDMKQSIYRFRLADPLIFRDKARQFSKGSGLVRMNDNFRSDRGVIDAVNAVMGAVMSETLGEIEYSGDERLIASREGGRAEILMVATDAEDDEENVTAKESEAKAVAGCISELLSETITDGGIERAVTPDDICILMRSRTAYPEFSEALLNAGIPVTTDNAVKSEYPEIEIFVNFLRLTDTSRSDTALLSALRWEGFDERDFAQIRAAHREGTFYEAFLAMSEGAGELALRARDFLDMISRFKLYARNMPVANAVMRIKTELCFDVRVAALPPAARGRAFSAFIEQCADAPAYARESIFAFVSYLDDLKRDRSAYFSAAEAEPEKGAVRLMTIHKSKGLEFPIVIIARTGAMIHNRDLGNAVYMHGELGIAVDLRDETARIKTPSAIRRLVRGVLEREYRSEELRILYVAMTRAKNRLIISGTTKNVENELSLAEAPMGAQGLLKKTSLLAWVLYGAAQADGQIFELRRYVPSVETADFERKRTFTLADWQALAADAGVPEPFALPDDELGIPSKLSVSSLLPVFDTEADDMPKSASAVTKRRGALGGAQLGTVLHDVLQRLDFSERSERAVLARIQELETALLLTSEEANAARGSVSLLTRFLDSPIAARARASKRVYRELPFCLSATARELGVADSDETVIVQGRIDLVFEEKGALVLVDYKSGAKSLSSIDRYAAQLSVYGRAVRSITELPVSEKLLVFLATGEELRVE